MRAIRWMGALALLAATTKLAADLAWAVPRPALISSRARAMTLGGPEASWASAAEADSIRAPRTQRRRSMGNLLFGEWGTTLRPGGGGVNGAAAWGGAGLATL